METRRRSIYKTLSWRVIATLITMLVAFAITREVDFALEIGALDTTIKLVAYFLHERAWLRVSWGKVKEHDYQI